METTPVVAKKKFYKKWWFWVIVVIIVLGLIGNGDNPSSTTVESTTSNSTQQAPAIKVTALKLSSDYKANEVAADAKYKGNTIEVSGIVDTIGKDILDTPYVSLKTEEYSIVGVQCMFGKADEATLATLTKGQSITLQGQVSGKLGNVLVRGCKIVQ